MANIPEEVLLALAVKNKGGGGGGTTNYNDLSNQPQINSNTLIGNKSASDLGLADADTVQGILDGQTIDSFGDVETALADKVDNVIGKGLSSNDFTDEYKTAIGANTTAISGIKDGQSIDSFADVEGALSDVDTAINGIKDGTDIDSFADVESALSDVDDDIDSLKSGFTNLDNEVNGDATTYPYADVITIPDAVPANLADCNVKIEPVQDLHGYDHPWVGGAGRQKLPLVLADIKTANTDGAWSGNVYTINGDTIEVLVDSDNNVLGFKINKTHNNAISFNIFDSKSYVFDGSYDFVGESILKNGEIAYTYTFDNTSIDVTNPNGVTQAVDDNLNHAHIYIWAAKTFTNQIVTPMVCLSSETDKSFAPYTNICHISGHTGVDVQRDGVNLVNASNRTITSETTIFSKNVKAGTYSVSVHVKNNSAIPGRMRVFVNEAILDTVNFSSTSTVKKENILLENDAVLYVSIGGTRSGYSYDISNVQLELGSTATPYVPYAGKTYTIAIGDTIYGGIVDFNTGVMTVTHGIKDLGTLEWTYDSTNARFKSTFSGIKLVTTRTLDMTCECYQVISDGRLIADVPSYCIYNDKGGGGVDIHDSRYNDPTDLTTALNGMNLVYPIETPFTVQLTPQQIQLLKGQNTLTASTGDISVTVNGVSGAIGAVQEQVNELSEKVAVTKELRYTGTGTVPNTIDFGNDTPKRIIGIIPDPDEEFVLSNYEAIGEISWGMFLTLSYWSTQSGGVPTTNNGGTNMIRMSFSGNTVTLNAQNAAQVANYSGQKYLVKYEV